jgi:Nucleotidyl transferase AbiEii toxin, Type IV TA system
VSKEPNAERYDPRIIRHLYDLSYLAPQVIDDPQWLDLSYRTIAHDLETRDRELANLLKSPGELLSKLIEKLTSNQLYQSHYQDFVETVAYGESPTFQTAVAALNSLTSKIQGKFSI